MKFMNLQMIRALRILKKTHQRSGACLSAYDRRTKTKKKLYRDYAGWKNYKGKLG